MKFEHINVEKYREHTVVQRIMLLWREWAEREEAICVSMVMQETNGHNDAVSIKETIFDIWTLNL